MNVPAPRRETTMPIDSRASSPERTLGRLRPSSHGEVALAGQAVARLQVALLDEAPDVLDDTVASARDLDGVHAERAHGATSTPPARAAAA